MKFPSLPSLPSFREAARARAWTCAALAGLGGLACLPAQAQAPLAVQTDHAARYLNGGVGQDERAVLKQRAAEFPLHLSFSQTQGGEYMADIPVKITDAAGAIAFELAKAGPMLYIALPDGKYHVTAGSPGATESRDITVAGKKTQEIALRFK